MTESAADAEQSTAEYGVTDEDRKQIAAYLETPRHVRSVDDLRRSSKR